MYEIILAARAADYYEALPPSMQKRINKAIDSLENNPLSGSQIKKLSGKLNLLSFRTVSAFSITVSYPAYWRHLLRASCAAQWNQIAYPTEYYWLKTGALYRP